MQTKAAYSHVIWDWNGTLLDDAPWCFQVINGMLARRGLRELPDMSAYHEVFGFPILEYYQKVGFDFTREPFERLAEEYIFLYHSENSSNCQLHPHAQAVLATIHERHISQIILSASEQGNLLSQVSCFDITGYFDEILGISDIFATSKLEVALDYMTREKISRAVLIGDTEHDYQVAQRLGVDCLLIANGHQGRERLLACKVPVLDDISCVLEYI